MRMRKKTQYPKWACKIRWALWESTGVPNCIIDTDWYTSLNFKAREALCLFMGHVPEKDQCSIPEHDYCITCDKLTPYQARR